MRNYINKWIVSAVLASLMTTIAAASKRPNVVIILADDQGYGDLGCFGSQTIKTPVIDGLAAEGMKFTQFYVTASVCTPSRASLMTGSYPARVGFSKGVVFPDHEHGLPAGIKTLPDLFKEVGYTTGMVGKWHLGHSEGNLPLDRGFDYFYGAPYSNDMVMSSHLKVSSNMVLRNGRTKEDFLEKRWGAENRGVLMQGDEVIEFPADQTLWTQRFTEKAVDFIKANSEQPFFLYVAHCMPHLPIELSERFAGKSAHGPYGDTIQEIDWSTGEILKALRDTGVDQNTLLVYTSDNGPWIYAGSPEEVGTAGPLRDGKSYQWEGGMRMPTVMWGPGIVASGKVCDEMASTLDLYTTFAKLIGATLPSDRELDGYDISALWSGDADVKSPRDSMLYFSLMGELVGIRKGDWKLLLHSDRMVEQYMKKAEKHKFTHLDNVELFNLQQDVSEKYNLADENPEKVKTLRDELQRYRYLDIKNLN
ncbi:sulfatase family protein [Persicirhabdus sediminis]|uniref:sulfatase family protein n=1 Tax=Persicirhabdus sediminis TaxID=454144 RepID=UPI001F2BCFE4|nr:sulfatase [Persicirhabdus sediminis]